MPQPQHTRLAGIYVRISDDKDGAELGVRRQEKDSREKAARLGWNVGRVYTENDTSAYRRRKVQLPDGTAAMRVLRPAFRQLLDDIAAGTITALVAYDLDRIARDPRDLEDLVDAVEARKIPTTAVTGDIDLATDNGIFMARMLVNVANKASRDSSRRIKRKHLELAEDGKPGGGGRRAYGYDRDGMVVVDSEADVLREVARRIIDGESLSAIARHLTEAAVPTVSGIPRWETRSVHSAVTKPRVAGLRQYRGEVVGPARWPAILDVETWERVRMALDQRATGSSNTLRYWLTTVLRCGACGMDMTGHTANRGRYWCNPQRGGCASVSIGRDNVEALATDLLTAYLGRPDVLADLQKATSSDSTSVVRAEVQADEQQLRELAELWAARDVSTKEYLAARRVIEERLVARRHLLQMSLPGSVRTVLTSDDVGAAFAALTPHGRREVARVVWPSGVTIEPVVKGVNRFNAERFRPVDWGTTS